MPRSPLCAPLLLLLAPVMLVCGCRPASTTSVLIGKWDGQPDSFAARRERTPIPTAEGYVAPAVDESQSEAEVEAARRLAALQPSEKTDLEEFKFVVTLEFMPLNRVDMTLNGGQKIEGSWKVLSTDAGVSVLELVDGVPRSNDKAANAALTKRRYLLEFDEDRSAFTLREEGVDPRFGWLYFKRAAG